MRLELPDGIGVGDLATFVYPPNDRIEPGEWEGRIQGIKGPRLTVDFIYPPGSEPDSETIVINLETGMDETYHAPVSENRSTSPLRA